MEGELLVSPQLDTLLEKLNLLEEWLEDLEEITKLRFAVDKILNHVLIAEKKLEKLPWLEEVQKAAYDADDVLDQMAGSGRSSFLLKIKFLGIRLFMVPNVRVISLRFDRLSQDLPQAAAAADDGTLFRSHIQAHTNIPMAAASVEQLKFKKIVGRDADKKKILEWLIDDNLQQFSVLPILGVDGMGKTTLTRMVYDDEKVLKHFDLRAWASVDAKLSQDGAAEIGKAIVESVTGMSFQLTRKDEVDDLVRDTLESKRCLIVLDDIDSISGSIWLHMLKFWFPAVALGSKLIVTTSSEEVGGVMGADKFYTLESLSNEDSWSVFNQLAFDPSLLEKSSPILATAQMLVDTCRGIPILLEIVGSLMRFQNTEAEWLAVQSYYEDVLLPSSSSSGKQNQNLLLLCYHNLPSHLKQCFAYCSIFRKNCVLEKDKRIQMWIAEGLVQSTGGKEILEDIGNAYLQELLRRPFLTDVKGDEYGEITALGMHTLIHNFATSVAGFNSVKRDGFVCRQSTKFRQVSLDFDSGSSTIPTELGVPKHLRTLLLLSGNVQGTLHSLFLRSKRLTFLDLSVSSVKKLPPYINILQHLKYLDLLHTLIKRLPDSITKLKHLQTLNLSRCSHLKELPKGMHNMTELRHLDVSLCHSLSHIPSRIGRLVSLLSLPVFILGKNKGAAHLGELRNLNLRGKLEIKNLGNVRHITEARGAKLYQKENLQHLGLSWDHAEVGCPKISSDLLLESLWPHPKLEVLDITGYNGNRFPSWMRDSSINNLVKIFITNCGCMELPPLGQLPDLKEVYIRGMSNLQSIGPEFYGNNSATAFPLLQQIELSNMPNLVEWSDFPSLKESTSTAFPCLNTMAVEDCPKLGGFPFLPAVKNLILWNSNKELLCSLANLRSLSSLVINDYQVIFPGDLGNSNSIEKLMIHHCGFLDCPFEEGMQGFTSVKHLGILYCHELTSLPTALRYFTSLQNLDIRECHNLVLIPDVMECLPSLKELVIEG